MSSPLNESKVDTITDKGIDSTDSDVRYMAYASRLRTALRATTRYVAYVSYTISCEIIEVFLLINIVE